MKIQYLGLIPLLVVCLWAWLTKEPEDDSVAFVWYLIRVVVTTVIVIGGLAWAVL